MASPSELQHELSWASNRSGSLAHLTHGFSPGCPLSLDTKSAFRLALCGWELKHLVGFEELERNVAYIVATNPKQRRHASTPTTMCTLMRGMHLVWVDSIDRWMSARELLCFQGVPCYDRFL